MLKIRWSHNRLIFNMEIPIPWKTAFILRQGPGCRQLNWVWEWISNFIPHFIMDILTCPYWDKSQPVLVKEVLVFWRFCIHQLHKQTHLWTWVMQHGKLANKQANKMQGQENIYTLSPHNLFTNGFIWIWYRNRSTSKWVSNMFC